MPRLNSFPPLGHLTQKKIQKLNRLNQTLIGEQIFEVNLPSSYHCGCRAGASNSIQQGATGGRTKARLGADYSRTHRQNTKQGDLAISTDFLWSSIMFVNSDFDLLLMEYENEIQYRIKVK